MASETPRSSGIPGEIDLEGAAALLAAGQGVFVDIRDPASYAAGHIPGAVYATQEAVEALLASTDPGAPIVVYCYHGNNSRSAARWFHQRGFPEARSLTGGFTDWEDAASRDPAFPITTGRG